MKKICLIITIVICVQAKGQDYSMHINDSTFNISLDKDYEVSINGKTVKLKISQHDTLKYDDELYSFLYTKDLKVSKNLISEGIEQLTLLTAEGSGVIIQKHTSMNPSKLNELMLGELTKKNIDYGFEQKREDYKRVLKSGQTLTVDKVILTYKDKVYNYEVASIGNKDDGIIVVTLLFSKDKTIGQKIINLLWDSLFFK